MIHCPHAERCGGCALIALGPDEQQRFKHERVARALGGYTPLVELQLSALQNAETVTHYRTRAKLVVSARGEIGLFERASHDVIDIPECQVLSPLLAAVVADVRSLLQGGDVPISGLDLREVRDGSEAGVLLTLIGPSARRAAIEALAARLRDRPQLLGVAF
ncbi:MAG TPA: hypothetical protein VJV78_20045, partial [Polyangiales bacterium]|nr:hypothetical protein [Polyangiales bacterium]